MKQSVLFMLAVLSAAFISCSNDSDVLDNQEPQGTKEFTFNVEGEFTMTPFNSTRAATTALQADDKDMEDLWVLDYMGNELVQQIHQVKTEDNFGSPTLNLKYGKHHIYFIASRGQNPVLDTDNKIISFSKVLDTFYKDYTVDVVATTNGNRSVILDRIVTKLKLTFTDVIPEDAATFKITPATWYYSFNYVSGTASTATNNTAIIVNIPDSQKNNPNAFVTIYSISPLDEWHTDINLKSYTANEETLLGEASLADVPLMRNRGTEYSGPLYSSNGTGAVNLGSEWSTSVTGTW